MFVEYERKKTRLKKQWSYIDAALKIVQLTQQSEKSKSLLEAIMKSDCETYDKLLADDPLLVECPIPVGYNHFNIHQIIIERSTETFIDHVLTKYFDMIKQSTEDGRILVPVACERGDGNVLQLIRKYFPRAPLNGTSSYNQSHKYLLHDEPRHLLRRELEAFENEIPLACVIRNDRADLLAILSQFQSFTLQPLSSQQKQQIFHLCLLAEHRHVSIDKYNIKWFKNQSLRPCGSIECLRFLIEHADLNPFLLSADDNGEQQPSSSPFTLLLEPVYLYLIQLHNKLLMDLQMTFHVRLLRALYDLIDRQVQLFTYLITHCCLQPSETDLIRLSECQHYVDEVFHQSDDYRAVKRMLSQVTRLVNAIKDKHACQCLSLKQLCRLHLRDYVRREQRVLAQVERTFSNLSTSHKKYLKYLV